MIRIDRIFTMDPADVWTPKDVFFPNDPFGITMIVSASADLVEERLRYDMVWQMVNPRSDPYETGWYSIIAGDAVGYHTIDWHARNNLFQWQNFGTWVSWAHYSDAVSHVRGPSKNRGVFAVRGSIEVVGTDLFDLTLPFAFNYKVRMSAVL